MHGQLLHREVFGRKILQRQLVSKRGARHRQASFGRSFCLVLRLRLYRRNVERHKCFAVVVVGFYILVGTGKQYDAGREAGGSKRKGVPQSVGI